VGRPARGALVADPALLDGLWPDKLVCSPNDVPERFETGTAPFADFAGVTAAVDHLAGLAAPARATRRDRLLASMALVEEYERELFAELLETLEATPHVTTYGKAASRTPTAYFTVSGHSPRQVADHLASRGVNVWSGHNYAWELVGVLGLRDSGGALRAGIVHYNDRSDVDRLLAGLAELG
jgi:selenocysteine lyase/cysteine desulfurase